MSNRQIRVKRNGQEFWVGTPGKPPRRRYNPGDFILLDSNLLEVVYAYRLEEDPNVWLYCCGFREKITDDYV